MKFTRNRYIFASCSFKIFLLFLSLISPLVVVTAPEVENIDPRKDPLLGKDFADNVKALLYIGGNNDPKEFKWSEPESLTSAGFKKGKRYRWLIHDWCGDHKDMLPMARAYKQTYPQENIILIDFSKPKVASFSTMKTLVKNYAVQSLYFLYGIFDTIDIKASNMDVRSKSHVIGFGFGALIGSWFGAAASENSRNLVKQLGYPFKSDGVPYIFDLPRLTILDPIGKCIYIEEENSAECPDVTKWPLISSSSDHANFTDGIYTSKLSIPTLCPKDAGVKRMAHHRGVYINEGLFQQPGCSNDETFSVAAGCKELSKSCTHYRAIGIYAGIIPNIKVSHKGCDAMVGTMFGDRDPNADRDPISLATNYHVDTEEELPFSRPMSCNEIGKPAHKDYESLYPECGQQQVAINGGGQWEVKNEGNLDSVTHPGEPERPVTEPPKVEQTIAPPPKVEHQDTTKKPKVEEKENLHVSKNTTKFSSNTTKLVEIIEEDSSSEEKIKKQTTKATPKGPTPVEKPTTTTATPKKIDELHVSKNTTKFSSNTTKLVEIIEEDSSSEEKIKKPTTKAAPKGPTPVQKPMGTTATPKKIDELHVSKNTSKSSSSSKLEEVIEIDSSSSEEANKKRTTKAVPKGRALEKPATTTANPKKQGDLHVSKNKTELGRSIKQDLKHEEKPSDEKKQPGNIEIQKRKVKKTNKKPKDDLLDELL